MNRKLNLLKTLIREEVRRQVSNYKLTESTSKIFKSGPFSLMAKSGIVQRNGKDVWHITYYDDDGYAGYYQVKLPLTDPKGKKLPNQKLFFDSAQETVDWFRQTDMKYDWSTAFDRAERDNSPVSIYDYD